ncbi:MAG: NAD(P)-dependent alcohol dehydrogenase [Candidatus Caldarchaeum sp.]
MKAAVLYKPKDEIKIENVADPGSPKGTQVLVKIQSSGLCHTDIHIWEGHYGPIRIEERGVRFPLIMGHEIAGFVHAVGESVTGLKPGDRVVVYPWIGDNSCKMCVSGYENLCMAVKPLGILANGGFAEYVLVPHHRYCIKFYSVSFDEAAPMACAGITAYSALKKASFTSTDYLMVIGVGGLGHLAIQMAKFLYGATVVAVDVRDEALDHAAKLGADHVINASRQNVVDEAKKLTNGAGVDAVVDFVNTAETSRDGFNALRKAGRLILVGVGGYTAEFILPLIAIRSISISGSYVGTVQDLMETVSMLEKGKIKTTVTPMKLEHVNEALKMLLERKVVGRIILRP